MFLPKILLGLLFVYSCYAKECSDCVLLRSCPEAVAYATANKNKATVDKLKQSLCGVETVKESDKPSPKVCCSDFSIGTSDRTGDLLEDFDPSEPLENHPNYSLLPQDCGQINGDRIIGGTIANLAEFPWMTLISYRTRTGSGKNSFQFKCGATIINSRYILTAAHCIDNKKLAGVRVGEFDISTKTDCQGEPPYRICQDPVQDILIEESITHEEYQGSPVKNDIALLRLKNPIDFTPNNAKPICLPVQEALRNATLGGRIATVAGWGVTESGTESLVLRKVDIPILTSEACRGFYNKNSVKTDATLKKLCAGELKKDSCSGDSGGPLMKEEQIDGKYRIVQFGVVSYGPKQCGSQFPGVYTDITHYMKWILDHIRP